VESGRKKIEELIGNENACLREGDGEKKPRTLGIQAVSVTF